LSLESGTRLLRVIGGLDASAPEDFSSEALKARTFDTLRSLLFKAAKRTALLIAVEDIHWIDRTSEEFLATLVERLAGAPIMIVTTHRPGHRVPWLDRSYLTHMTLRPLIAVDSAQLVESVAPGQPLPETVSAAIVKKGEGNPFFLEELARAVGDHRRGVALQVPDTVHGVLTARIDRLDEDDKRVLQTASVLGREFTPALLAAIWDGEGAIDPRLRQLTRLEFLSERASGDEIVYAFKHALTLDVAEATLLPSRRRELHRRAGEGLERLYPERLAELAPRLADHYREAEAWAPAVRFAHRNQMDLSINIVTQASVQIALFVTPLLVLLSFPLGHKLDLNFSLFEIVSVVLAVGIVAYLIQNGESNWFEGVQLLALYTMIAVAIYFLP